MENQIATVETSVQLPNALQNIQPSVQDNSGYNQPPEQKEISYLKVLVAEKDARIEQLTQENKFLYTKLREMEKRIEVEFKRSDVLIDQMQTAADESSKRSHAIIMYLSRQVEQQAEQIGLLQKSQGLGEVVREKVLQLKSKIPPIRISTIKQAVQSHFSATR